jgi:hypothetical protein
MGITISYRGRLTNLTRVEDLEDRLLDLALELGGLAQIWRSCADGNPERMVRGIILHLAPGQETTSLLFAPEGWLIGLAEIKDAEQGRLTEPPWVFTKTQFGPLEGHVALVELLAALKREFVPDLEVVDEGGYWETRDLAELTRKHRFLQAAIEGLAEGLSRHGLSWEAAEDPEILLQRIERIAAQVQRTLRRPAEHPPVRFPEEDPLPGARVDPETDEALWDEMFKHNRRQQERMQRSLEERRSRGEEDDEALENAIRDLGLELPGEEVPSADDSWSDERPELTLPDELDSAVEEEDPLMTAERERHPLLQRAMDLVHDLHTIFRDADGPYESSLRTLFQGAGDIMGGLAQALSTYEDDEDDELDMHGLRIVQLKRALRGAAFARGALFSLSPLLTVAQRDGLARTFAQMQEDIFQHIGQLRSQRGGADE